MASAKEQHDEVGAGAEVDYDVEQAKRFYSKLRGKIAGWFARRGGKAGGAVGEVLLLLPDFFALVMRLMGDKRLSARTKVQLAAVSAYVISPIDFLPDFLFPIGFVDDTVALAFVLGRIARMMDEAGPAILEEHWEGSGSVLAAIRKVTGLADGMLNGRVLGKLQRRFGRGGGNG